MDAVAQTALWTAAARARESTRADRLFEDPWAAVLAGEVGVALLEAESKEARENPYLAIRTRYYDDWVQAVTERGVRQVVLLGAGMDTRAFRLVWPPEVTLWELDRPGILDLKEQLLQEASAVPQCQRCLVRVDLTGSVWLECLRAAGFHADEPSCWLAEGFFEYLEADEVGRILAATASLAAVGSCLGADFLAQDFLTSPWMASYLSMLEQRGTPWRFGTNEPERLLVSWGWEVEAVREPGEIAGGFGRWPWPVVPRSVPGIPRSFLVTARRVAP